MEFAMREWLTVIIVLLIAGILLDGWRRMRQSRRDSIKMSRNIYKGSPEDDVALYGSELPNGGARVVDSSSSELQKNSPPKEGVSPPQIKADMHEQVGLDLEEEVPMLMESVAEPIDDDALFADGVQEGVGRARTLEPTMPTASSGAELLTELGIANEKPVKRTPAQSEPKRPLQSSVSAPAPREIAETQEVLVINVMARRGQYFQGAALLDILLDADMRFGDMDIFHRHRDTDGEGPVLFSMANMVKPGTFDLHRMSEFSTPGVSLFLTLPLPSDSLEAFNIMASIAKYIVDQLGGELKDEERSVMTNQTLEHCRQRIREFERKRLV